MSTIKRTLTVRFGFISAHRIRLQRPPRQHAAHRSRRKTDSYYWTTWARHGKQTPDCRRQPQRTSVVMGKIPHESTGHSLPDVNPSRIQGGNAVSGSAEACSKTLQSSRVTVARAFTFSFWQSHGHAEPASNNTKPSLVEKLATGRADGVHLGTFVLRHY